MADTEGGNTLGSHTEVCRRVCRGCTRWRCAVLSWRRPGLGGGRSGGLRLFTPLVSREEDGKAGRIEASGFLRALLVACHRDCVRRKQDWGGWGGWAAPGREGQMPELREPYLVG